jgi:hypothetical protein
MFSVFHRKILTLFLSVTLNVFDSFSREFALLRNVEDRGGTI